MQQEIDLSQLPAPQAIEEISFKSIFEREKQKLIALCPEHIRTAIAATLELESEPLTIDLQQRAYAEMLLRTRINEAARATFLAFATGSDLDHIAASRGLSRKIIQEADEQATPPIPEIKESDTALRKRVQMHPEKFAAAGPRAAYKAHALDVDGVADANPIRHKAGTVRVYIKAHANNGIADASLLAHVKEYLSAEERRPLCDTVEVESGSLKNITIRYQTRYQSQLGKEVVQSEQQKALDILFSEHAHLGAHIALSKIIGALDVAGAEKVILHEPSADIECDAGEFIHINAIQSSELV